MADNFIFDNLFLLEGVPQLGVDHSLIIEIDH